MAQNAKRVAGVLQLTIDGTAYSVVGSVTYGLSKVEREMLKDISGITGNYKEMPVPGFIAAQLRDSGSISVTDFSNMTSVSVVLTTASGKRIVGDGVTNVRAVEVDPIEGTFDVRFEGNAVTEERG